MSGLMILIFCAVLGGALSQTLGLPLPGSIMGMIMLLLVLVGLRRVPQPLHDSVASLTPYMPLFIVPASVGLITQTDLLLEYGLELLFILAVSLIPGALVCAVIMRWGKSAS